MKIGMRDRARLGELIERMLDGRRLVWVRTPDGASWHARSVMAIRHDGLVVLGDALPPHRPLRLAQVGQLRTEDPR